MFGLVKESRLKELQEKYVNLSRRIEWAKEKERENNQLCSELNKVIEGINNLKKQIREQTEADLFFISAKIQKKLLDGESKEKLQPDIQLQHTYQQQLAQQQAAYCSPFYSQTSSFLQGLGLGNLFGR